MITRRKLIQRSVCLGASFMLPNTGFATETASSAGFFYPEEARAHERTFMQWPVNPAVHDDPVFLAALQKTIADLANRISDFEPVVMLMAKDHETAARKLLGAKVEIWDIATDDLWARDSGPSFVIDGKGGLALTQFNFNGWGGKQVHDNDGKVAGRVAERMGLKVFNSGIVGEAGGVEADGAGLLIAHESSWINPNRNAGTKEEVTKRLMETMGAKGVIWAPGVKDADITDYHIDALARFLRPGVVIVQLPDELDENDPWSKAAFETFNVLEATRDLEGNFLQNVIIPQPVATRVKSEDFVASYANFYVCNGAVIASEFGDKERDAEVGAVLKEIYPDREIVMMNTDPIGEVGGGIHCATHEQPKA
ncbi:MAG: agmatine deiminase family protein [Rhizobiaceae bacterium]